MGNEHWERLPLKQVAVAKKGKKSIMTSTSSFIDSVPLIDIEAMDKGNYRSFVDRKSSVICNKNDILVVWDGARFGLTGCNQEGAVGSTIMRLTPRSINSKYLFRFITSKYLFIQNKPKGMAIPHVNPEIFWNIIVPTPPVDEQVKIVEKLDFMLSKVIKAKGRLENIRILIKKFRQSILSAACSGVLTDENSNYDDERWAKVINSLQEDVLDSSFAMPSHWVCVPLKSIANGFQYGTSSKSDISGLIPVIRMGNLQNGIIDWNGMKYTSDLSEIKKYALEAGDVLFNRTNSPDLVGKTSIYESDRNAIFAGYLIRIKNKKDILLSEFLNYYLNSQYGREWCKQVRTDGVGQSNISASMLSTLPIPLPPIEEQREIVTQVQQLFKLADSLEAKYKKAMLQIDKLEQSILAKAFQGELIEA